MASVPWYRPHRGPAQRARRKKCPFGTTRRGRPQRLGGCALEASRGLTEIADESRGNRDLGEEEAHFAERALSWAAQVQLLAGAMLQTLGVEGPEEPDDPWEKD